MKKRSIVRKVGIGIAKTGGKKVLKPALGLVREGVRRKGYMNRNPLISTVSETIMWGIDNVNGAIDWAGEEYRFPAHSEHGWYLESDD